MDAHIPAFKVIALRQEDGMVDLEQTPYPLQRQNLLINNHGLSSQNRNAMSGDVKGYHGENTLFDHVGPLQVAVPLHNGLFNAK